MKRIDLTVRGLDAYNLPIAERISVPVYNWHERLWRSRAVVWACQRFGYRKPRLIASITPLLSAPHELQQQYPWFTFREVPPQIVEWSEVCDPEKW